MLTLECFFGSLLSDSLLTGGSAGRAVNATCWCLDAPLLKATVLPGEAGWGAHQDEAFGPRFYEGTRLGCAMCGCKHKVQIFPLVRVCTDASTGRSNCHTDQYGFSAVLVAAQRSSGVSNRRFFVPAVISRCRYVGSDGVYHGEGGDFGSRRKSASRRWLAVYHTPSKFHAQPIQREHQLRREEGAPLCPEGRSLCAPNWDENY